MSLYDYQQSIKLCDQGFYALIMAAFKVADSQNTMILGNAYPALYAEVLERYNSPSGILESDRR